MAETKKPAIKKVAKTAVKETKKPKVDKKPIKDTVDKVVTEVKETKEPSPKAKAGKRSAKAIKEVAQKQAKEERKASVKDETAEAKPKQVQKPPRSKLERKGKKYRQAAEQIEKGKEYALEDAMALAVKTNAVKFDATVELHLNLAVDPKQADQNVRGTVVLPAGSGRSSRVAVVAEADDAKKAKSAGADVAGSEDVFALLDKEKLDFDILIAHPSQMVKLAKYAKLLGPKGLMPNPKSGTVAVDVAKAVEEAKAGRVEYRVDSTGIIHIGIGRVSFGGPKLAENAQALLANLKANKPASVKGALILRGYISTTMGPSIPLNLTTARE